MVNNIMDTTTMIHTLIYTTTAISSYYLSLQSQSVLTPVLFGWSIYGFTTVAHDLLHKPTKRNKMISFLCMDVLLINSDYWIQYHNKYHHTDLDGDNDIMKLKGNTLLEEWYYLLEICKGGTLTDHIYRLPFYYVLHQLRWYQIIEIYMTIFFCLAYFTYITHSHTVKNNYKKNSIEHNLCHTIDIFPESKFINLLFGGINCHATHHCYPTCPRSKLYKKSRYLALMYPKHYRSIHTFKQLVNLYKHR